MKLQYGGHCWRLVSSNPEASYFQVVLFCDCRKTCFKVAAVVVVSVTRLGYFSKFMTINFHAKVAQIFGGYLGCFGKWYHLSKICRGYFLGNNWKHWAPFNFNIWSHWSSSLDGISRRQFRTIRSAGGILQF